MHIPDGFFDTTTSVAGGVAAVGTVAVAVRRAGDELAERSAPLAGLMSAFVFAVQMLNFPVASGTSGHVLGGALAAVVVGPWVGSLCVAVVLLVQALFADGGLTALGLNIVLIGVIPAFGGWGLFRALRAILPKRASSVPVCAGVAAAVTVPLSALVFSLLFAVGGSVDIPVGTLASAMVGVHVLIGVGEGLITALVLGAVMASRPDLVRGAQDLRPVPTTMAVARSAA